MNDFVMINAAKRKDIELFTAQLGKVSLRLDFAFQIGYFVKQ